MNNVAGTVEIALGIFNGVDTELSASDLPAGLSPDCSDVAFLPGSVFTRPPLQRLDTLGTTVQAVYAKSYTKPNGQVSQFRCYADGGMYLDGVRVGGTKAGNRFFAHEAFGRLYIAISDGLHGADVPLQLNPDGSLFRVSQDGPGGAVSLANYSLGQVALSSLTRANNSVTAVTSAPHGLIVGNRAEVSNVADASTGIVSIAINNESLPDVATVKTLQPHGFVPGDTIAILGVQQVVVGGGLTNYSIANGVATVTTLTPHELTVGTDVVVTLGPNGGPRVLPVTTTLSATQFTIVTGDADNSGTVGSVYLQWPEQSGQTFSIVATTASTFQIAVQYNDGTWNTGTVTFPWNGDFYVASVPDASTITYSQSGPDNAIDASGTLTPEGQITAGVHKCVCIFQTKEGYLTIPSPVVTFTTSGGGYVQVSNIPIGPSNVVARILAFTGADGGKYFYLPVPAQINGQIIGTSTVVNDNTTTSAIFDFSDQALFAAAAIDIPGNNLFRQEILGPCLGFFSYAGRMLAWGERNKIQQFRNMGFEGGYYAGEPNRPLGWTLTDALGTLGTSGDYGVAWTFGTGGVAGAISQGAFQDDDGIAILSPQTQYSFRGWATGTITAEVYSPTVGSLATATFTANGFGEADFSAKTPVVIPADTVIRVYADAGVSIDELEVIYTSNPYRLTARVSYEDNPEAFDGVTGVLGPATDPHPVFGMEERRDTLCILTNGPDGSLYETEDTASGEPSTWELRHVSSKCGLISVWGAAKFEDWFCWASDTGLRIFDGGTVDKISQEVQTWWNSFNTAAWQFTVVANDPYTRRMYVSSVTGEAVVNNSLYVMDYRELNSAGALSGSGALHISMQGGKVITSDLNRKWCKWSITANHCGVVSLASGGAVMTFCGGTGGTLADAARSAVYTLDEGVASGVDADYGAFWATSYYSSYFFVSADEAQAKQLGQHRLLHTFLTLNVSGNGAITVTPLLNDTAHAGKTMRAVPLSLAPYYDVEYGLNLSADRIAYRIGCQPTAGGTLAGFSLSSLILALRTHPYSPIRGRNS